jgi:peptide/nickel transport system substrate-binding protein
VRAFIILPLSTVLLFFMSTGSESQLPSGQGATLYVGVRHLPVYLSPALAFTDVEHKLLDLLFESLVEVVEDDDLGERFRPRLAVRLPQPTPLWREFRLRPDAHWPDGQPVTAADVRQTVTKLREPGWTGNSPVWKEIQAHVEDDPALVRIQFSRGQFQPLSLLTFPVLPQTFRGRPLRLDDPEFAKAPMGSGPYLLAPERRSEDGRDYMVFRANPHYIRAGKRPHFQEIRLWSVKDPIKEFQHPSKPMHLWFDATTPEITALAKSGITDVRSLANRRVYFLAVNHRVKMLTSMDLRRAIAHGIDREAILNKHFRAGKEGLHTALNGPYPAKSWACCPPPRVPANPFDLALAKSKTQLAKEQSKRDKFELTLKFPEEDPQVLGTCQDIKTQLAKLGIHVKLEGLSAQRLREAVDRRDYELAYYHLDYPDDTFTLWPFFEPEAVGPGGANFLGYEDVPLKNSFSRALGHRQFSEIQKLTHDIHAQLYEQMPLIPLWQLQTHIAFRGLNPGRINANRLFANIERWELSGK